jgi:hypothetical protein
MSWISDRSIDAAYQVIGLLLAISIFCLGAMFGRFVSWVESE